MDEHGDVLTQARRAYAAGDWSTVAALFENVPTEDLSADDLQAYFEALWWLGRADEAVRIGAAAYEALLAESRPAEAVMVAVLLALTLLPRGDEPQAFGWVGRAGRVLEEIPEDAVHGFFLFITEVMGNLRAGGDPAAVVDSARRVLEMGRRFDDPLLVREGRALVPTPECGDDDEPTPSMTEGPFFTPRSPLRASLIEPGMTGTRIVITGRVFARSCRPVPGALLDVWHADDAGDYDNEGYRCRGHLFADAEGRYRFETIHRKSDWIGGTMAPLAAGGRVFAGVTGGRYGIRGFLAAFDADMRMFALAEQLGYDKIWIAEHLFSTYGVVTSTQVYAAAIAERTERVRIGTAVVVLPFNHPLRTAADFALVDILSHGRLDFGAGRAYQPHEFRGLGVPMDESRAMFAEGLEIVLKAKPAAILFEGANPRHRHEWVVWRDAKLPDDKVLIPGCISSTSNYVEHPRLIAEQLCCYADIVGRDRVIAGADCGFGSFARYSRVDPAVAYKKLRALTEGAALATDRLWRSKH